LSRRWRTTLRYQHGPTPPETDRQAIVDWLSVALPKEGDVDPVWVLPVRGGWRVTLHTTASDASSVVEQAVALIEVVVGESERVLGRLVATDVEPVAY